MSQNLSYVGPMSDSVDIKVPADLSSWGDRKLENAINKGHASAGAFMKNFEQVSTLTGIMLLERKRRIGHGGWLEWCKSDKFNGSARTAQDYLRKAQDHLSNTQPTAHLDPPQEPTEAPSEPTWGVDDIDLDEVMREYYETHPRLEEPAATPAAPREETLHDAYLASVAAMDAVARAGGTLRSLERSALADELVKAHKIVRKVIMQLHQEDPHA